MAALDFTTIHAATVAVSELYDGLVAGELHRRLHVASPQLMRQEWRSAC